MLVLQVALGIVLAVLIIAFLPQILALGVIGLGIVIGIAALGGFFWLLSGISTEAGGIANLIGILVAFVIVAAAIYLFDAKVRPKIEAVIRVDLLDTLIAIAIAASGVFTESIFIQRIFESGIPVAQLVITQLFAIGLFAWSFLHFRGARRYYKSSSRDARATYQDSDRPAL